MVIHRSPFTIQCDSKDCENIFRNDMYLNGKDIREIVKIVRKVGWIVKKSYTKNIVYEEDFYKFTCPWCIVQRKIIEDGKLHEQKQLEWLQKNIKRIYVPNHSNYPKYCLKQKRNSTKSVGGSETLLDLVDKALKDNL
jgi:hypothetical protein